MKFKFSLHLVPLLFCAFCTTSFAAPLPLLGGKPETDERAVVQIKVRDSGYCSGSLVAPSFVLTAAHCILSGSAEEYSVLIAGRRYTIDDGWVHPDYNPISASDEEDLDNFVPEVVGKVFYQYVNDLAILHLEDSVPNVTPLPLWRNYQTQYGESATVMGYGISETHSSSDSLLQRAPALLSKIENFEGFFNSSDEVYERFLSGLSNTEKRSYFDSLESINSIFHEMRPGLHIVQAHETVSSACPGDSGGALLKMSGSYRALIGVTAGGIMLDSNNACSFDNVLATLYANTQSAQANAFLKNFPELYFLTPQLIELIEALKFSLFQVSDDLRLGGTRRTVKKGFLSLQSHAKTLTNHFARSSSQWKPYRKIERYSKRVRRMKFRQIRKAKKRIIKRLLSMYAEV